MILKELIINNFRCFEDFSMTFSPAVNVIVGKNGTGKSALIHAIHHVLSFVFSNDKSLGDDFLSSGINTLNVRSFDKSDFRYDFAKREYATSANLLGVADYGGKELRWSLYKRNSASAALYQSQYKKAFHEFVNQWREQGIPLPLFAYYSDSYPHRDVKLTQNTLDTIQKDSIPRNFGYYQWDEDSSCTAIWETRMCNRLFKQIPLQNQYGKLDGKIKELLMDSDIDSNSKQYAEYNSLVAERDRIGKLLVPIMEEINFVTNRLKRFSSLLPHDGDNEWLVDYFMPEQTEGGFQLRIVFENGRNYLLQDLPAGYRRVFSMVLDIAYRAYILNGDKEPSGVDIIDEIDLHLHPALEQAVLVALAETFANIQFIVTTHSVSVISNMETLRGRNQVVALIEGENKPRLLPDVFGVDYNSVLRDFMGTPSRNDELKHLGDRYLLYKENNMEDEALSVLEKIKSRVGENSQFVHDLTAKA